MPVGAYVLFVIKIFLATDCVFLYDKQKDTALSERMTLRRVSALRVLLPMRPARGRSAAPGYAII